MRYRVGVSIKCGDVRVRPELVFTRARVAVFVDGCFWHSCPEHGDQPRSNTGYWRPKLQSNVARDRRVDQALREDGWQILRAWEHEDPREVSERVRRAVADARRRAL
jgi:DNA mismatch endonuclease (patch repair protein)